MAGKHRRKHNTRTFRKRKSRTGKSLIVGLALVLLISAIFIGVLLWKLLAPEKPPEDTISSSAPSAPTTTTALPTAAVTTTTTTAATTTTVTTSRLATTTAGSGRELLQYDTTGRYVQGAVTDWRLLLVNDWNAIDASYEKGITLVSAGNRNQKVDSRILSDLNAMLAAGKAYGIDVQSGYRGYSHQSTLYWRQVDRYRGQGYADKKAQEIAGTIVKRPGYSEHNSALAVDLGGSGDFSLSESFENTAAYRWLIENCADYGFILRFPKEKESVTGVIYEAWHFRYVGKEAAKEIMENGLCLEEYLAQNG